MVFLGLSALLFTATEFSLQSHPQISCQNITKANPQKSSEIGQFFWLLKVSPWGIASFFDRFA